LHVIKCSSLINTHSPVDTDPALAPRNSLPRSTELSRKRSSSMPIYMHLSHSQAFTTSILWSLIVFQDWKCMAKVLEWG